MGGSTVSAAGRPRAAAPAKPQGRVVSIRNQAAVFALFAGVGLALASPGYAKTPVLVLGAAAALLVSSIFIERFGVRSLALACLALTGLLVPMNALRLGANVTIADVFLVPSGILAVLARMSSTKPLTPKVEKKHVIRDDILAASMLIAGGIFGSQFATSLGSSLSAILRFGLAAVGVPLVFLALALDRREVRLLSWAYLIGASINAVVGIATYNPLYRGIGLSTHSNHLGAGCLLASGFAAGFLLTGTRRSSWIAGLAWAILILGILKSGSRAAVVGEALLILGLLAATGSTRILKYCLVLSFGVFLLIHFRVVSYDAQDAIARLFGSNVSQSDAARADYRVTALEGIKRHPLTGAGFEDARAAHNVYLQVWGAAGVAGLAGVAILWRAGIRGVLDGLADDRWLLATATTILSFLVIAAVSNILWDRYLWYAIAILVTSRATHGGKERKPTSLPSTQSQSVTASIS